MEMVEQFEGKLFSGLTNSSAVVVEYCDGEEDREMAFWSVEYFEVISMLFSVAVEDDFGHSHYCNRRK
jgi:hypothetical protein